MTFNGIIDELVEMRSDGDFSLEIQSGAFRFYPRSDKAKKGIWKTKKRFDIPTNCEKWEDVWSLYLHPLDGNIFKVTIQK